MKKLDNHVPLIVIDVQNAFEDAIWGKRNNPFAERNIEKLIDYWNLNQMLVIYVKHLSKNKESLFYYKNETSEFKEMINPLPKDIIIKKSVNSAFIGTNLEEILRKNNCPNIVITGLTTNHCVETTTRMAGNLGFYPYLVSDATATFDRQSINGETLNAEKIHEMTLTNLHEEFAIIKKTEEIVAML
ncbi:cysteine hydrolase family protein [Halalkalibacterium halodurans]|uniref:cysteine hydrolase family protein n=1 Tax=Halalkalibacterium halodurans TaxID=86665 RepID=UPI002E1B48E3|nr:cysteine hydrolase family protein [Halalkalibacterium halodurans]MED4085861.1 cysteine hydrolase family protein [Halalkalibacterium halodurans]MED4105206.1 cysteine hydrolase family protein [Halalkalibacterium halodurans]MED4111074.1 cysteine hydrolase family protein [Halalkalibacterium halodurans]MED4149426.1 cysteine hydrolase family protein [Halalkalibacterium halodurans]